MSRALRAGEEAGLPYAEDFWLGKGQTEQVVGPSSTLLGWHKRAGGDLPAGPLADQGSAGGGQPRPWWGNRILLWHQPAGSESVTCAWAWLLLAARTAGLQTGQGASTHGILG